MDYDEIEKKVKDLGDRMFWIEFIVKTMGYFGLMGIGVLLGWLLKV